MGTTVKCALYLFHCNFYNLVYDLIILNIETTIQEEEANNEAVAKDQQSEPVPVPTTARKLVSRQTQTVNLTISSRDLHMDLNTLQVPAQTLTSARTLTRQLRTGTKRGTLKRSTLQKPGNKNFELQIQGITFN